MWAFAWSFGVGIWVGSPCWSRERADYGRRVISFVYSAYMIPLDAADTARKFSSSVNICSCGYLLQRCCMTLLAICLQSADCVLFTLV
jgi:hypothetical protein